MIAKSVTSEPEPEVVGIATSFGRGSVKRVIALPQSSALPPPNASRTSGRNCRASAVPRAISSAEGSGVIWWKISTALGAASRAIFWAVPFS